MDDAPSFPRCVAVKLKVEYGSTSLVKERQGIVFKCHKIVITSCAIRLSFFPSLPILSYPRPTRLEIYED